MTCYFVEAHANFLLTINIQGIKVHLGKFRKNIFSIWLYSEACKPISFKLEVMLDMTQLYILIPV